MTALAQGAHGRPYVACMDEPPQDDDVSDDQDPAEGALARVMEIVNQKGLHARASAKFVQTVERFNAEVRVTRGSERVGGTSIMGLMMLSAAPGTTITVEAFGPQAAEVLDALEALIASRFGEEE
jgi:phosphocarrier protein HPr